MSVYVCRSGCYKKTSRLISTTDDLRGDELSNSITMRHVDFNDATLSEWRFFFENDTRTWEFLELSHCSGHVDVILSCLVNKVTQLCLMQSLKTDDAVASLGKNLLQSDKKSLKVLSIDLTTFTAQQAALFSNGLRKCEHLETLNFSRCTIDEYDAMSKIASGLEGNASIHQVRISACSFADESFSEWIRAIKNHPTLETLRIERCEVGVPELDSIARLLESESSVLKHLSLKWNRRKGGRFSDHYEQILPAPIRALKKNTSLISLDLVGNFVSDQDMTEWATVLQNNTTLQSLNLGSNQLTNPSKVMQTLQTGNSTLLNLDLSSNRIGDPEVQEFASCLCGMRTGLKKLNLRVNSFGLQGTTAILDALDSNTELESLELPMSDISTQKKLQHVTCFNRGGRRLIGSEEGVCSAIWPLVLERANRISYYNNAGDSWMQPTDESNRANVIFSLLLGPVLLEHRSYR
jgi:Ran GTPase-activating protein (RanGAP) involved in mRNA processing and transport